MNENELGTKADLIDQLRRDWASQAPLLDTSAMEVVGRILWLGRMLEERMVDVLAPFDLHYTDLDILATLARQGQPYCLTPTQLRNSVLISSGAMTAALNRLERQGLISRAQDSRDRRIKHAELTKQGNELVKLAIAKRFNDAQKCIANLSTKEFHDLASGLRKLAVDLRDAQIKTEANSMKKTVITD